ncbi:MAG: hypothetical protein ACKOA1_03160 [Bacteroidota bacterium]
MSSLFRLRRLFVLFPSILVLSNIALADGIIYSDSAEYVKAKLTYDHQLKSYENYIQKRELYLGLELPDLNHAPARWVEDYFSPKMQASGIFFDNYVIRYFPDVEPAGNEYIVVYQPNPASPELKMRFSNFEETGTGVVISVFYYAFNNPGDPPVFRKAGASTATTVTVSDPLSPASATDPDTSFQNRYYMMPNGRRYSYEELIRTFPSMKFNRVFKKAF